MNTMFNGKKKAITFSYDDGVTQDIRLIEMLNRYNLKATFNLNSKRLGTGDILMCNGVQISRIKNKPEDVKYIYEEHEVAAHTLNHPFLPDITDDKEVVRQVEQDRLNLSDLVGYEVTGMAYPGGGINNNDRIAGLIKNYTGIKYARTITSSYSFCLQKNLYRFNPTVYSFGDDGIEKMRELADIFFESDADEPQIFYIWGHAYEFDIQNNWDEMEEYLKYISGRDDIFYGTNSQVLLNNNDEL